MRPRPPGRPGQDHDQDTAPGAQDALDTRPVWALLFLALALFAKVPQMDLWFSLRYWTPERGFFHAGNPWVAAFQQLTLPVSMAALALALLLVLAGPLLARRASSGTVAARLRVWRRSALALLAVAVLASGLAIELGLKRTVGRPRPVDTVEFGGRAPFVPVLHLGDDPAQHRGFPSASAAAGFTLMSLGLGGGAAWRRRWLLAGVVAGSAIGMGRILQGGHYLSDVVFSFAIVWVCSELVALGLRRRFDRPPPGARRPVQRRAIR